MILIVLKAYKFAHDLLFYENYGVKRLKILIFFQSMSLRDMVLLIASDYSKDNHW